MGCSSTNPKRWAREHRLLLFAPLPLTRSASEGESCDGAPSLALRVSDGINFCTLETDFCPSFSRHASFQLLPLLAFAPHRLDTSSPFLIQVQGLTPFPAACYRVCQALPPLPLGEAGCIFLLSPWERPGEGRSFFLWCKSRHRPPRKPWLVPHLRRDPRGVLQHPLLARGDCQRSPGAPREQVAA